jgi:hypothetical protein
MGMKLREDARGIYGSRRLVCGKELCIEKY